MGSKLQKNAIMTGYINSYCLVCECCFDTYEETIDHIQGSGHADKLLAFPYLEKYGDNHIRKVNKGYFCEFCSLLLATAAKVNLHVQEKAHYEKKGTFLLRRPSGVSAVIAFDDLLIGERAWHSLTEDSCAICNEEFDNENIHKTESGHLLKLVQNKVEFGLENSVYRKTDDSSFQCLTCNAVFALNTLNNHISDVIHKKLYVECQENYKKYLEQNKPKASVKTKEVIDKKSDVTEDDDKMNIGEVKNEKDDVKDKKSKKNVDKNHNNVNSDTEVEAVSTQQQQLCTCTEMVGETTTTAVQSQPEDEETVFANANKLTYNAGNTNTFCRVCETKLPATLRSMKEHVNGKEHKNRLGRMNQQTQAEKLKQQIKKPMKKFIETCFTIEYVICDDVVLNFRYCLSLASFMMVTRVGDRLRCQACEMTFYTEELDDHSKLVRHDRAMQHTPVITSLPASEFVREVRAGIYHCGYCNLIIPRWDEVTSHLQSREHRENKDACMWRLQRHLPTITEHRRLREEELALHLYMRQMLFR